MSFRGVSFTGRLHFGTQIEHIKSEWQVRHDTVLTAGGLHIIGTERHESRRIYNQLRGRSGRQGDAGSTRFYLSMEDGLMRIFASERISGMMRKLGMEHGEAIEHPWVTRSIENAQRKVEGRNFDIRKQLLEFDDVSNDQRQVIYEQRNELMDEDDIADVIKNIRTDVVTGIINQHIPQQSLEEMWDIPGLEERIKGELTLECDNGFIAVISGSCVAEECKPQNIQNSGGVSTLTMMKHDEEMYINCEKPRFEGQMKVIYPFRSSPLQKFCLFSL